MQPTLWASRPGAYWGRIHDGLHHPWVATERAAKRLQKLNTTVGTET